MGLLKEKPTQDLACKSTVGDLTADPILSLRSLLIRLTGQLSEMGHLAKKSWARKRERLLSIVGQIR